MYHMVRNFVSLVVIDAPQVELLKAFGSQWKCKPIDRCRQPSKVCSPLANLCNLTRNVFNRLRTTALLKLSSLHTISSQ
jgi:hypothetical protein